MIYSNQLNQFKQHLGKATKVTRKKINEDNSELTYLCLNTCPAIAGPESSMKFKDYGIVYGHHFSLLKKSILETINIKKEDYQFFTSYIQLESKIDDIILMLDSRKRPVIFFTKGEGGEMDSLFIRIRNSFAHGNYVIKNNYYILWNQNGTKTLHLGSFMMLKKDHIKKIYSCLNQWND